MEGEARASRASTSSGKDKKKEKEDKAKEEKEAKEAKKSTAKPEKEEPRKSADKTGKGEKPGKDDKAGKDDKKDKKDKDKGKDQAAEVAKPKEHDKHELREVNCVGSWGLRGPQCCIPRCNKDGKMDACPAFLSTCTPPSTPRNAHKHQEFNDMCKSGGEHHSGPIREALKNLDSKYSAGSSVCPSGGQGMSCGHPGNHQQRDENCCNNPHKVARSKDPCITTTANARFDLKNTLANQPPVTIPPPSGNSKKQSIQKSFGQF